MSAPPLSYEQASRVISKLGPLGKRIVLVGGQAVNFWASYYLRRHCDELLEHAPYTSKDIDFFGRLEDVSECAKLLGGTAHLAKMDDMATPNTGVVTFVDDDNHQRVIDFLDHVAGLGKAVTGLPAQIRDESGEVLATVLVLDPFLCLKSRVANVLSQWLPERALEKSLRQLRAALICTREYGRELLKLGDAEGAHALNNGLLKYARFADGVAIHVRHRIDVLDALVRDEGLPAKFYSHRLRYAGEAIQRARRRGAAAYARELETRVRDEGAQAE